MAGHQNKLNALLEVIHVDLQPSEIRTAHVCGDDAGCNYPSGRPVIPLDTSRAHVRAKLDESTPRKLDQIQLWALLETDSFALTCHFRLLCQRQLSA